MSARTVPPTPRRIARAHDEGDVARSPLLAAAFALTTVAATTPLLLGCVRDRLRSSLEMISSDAPFDARGALAASSPALIGSSLAIAVAPWFAALLVGGVRVGALRVARAEAGLARAILVSLVLVAIALTTALRVASASAWRIADPSRALAVAIDVAVAGAGVALAFLAFAGALEALHARAAWRLRWSLTRAEHARDQRESAGDPALRARLRALARAITDRA